MRDFLKRWPWYAAVLAAYPLLYIAVTNPGQVEAADVVPVVAAGILAAVLLVGLVRPFAGTWAAAGLGAAWVILLFYLYGPANEWWLDWVRSGLEQQAAERTWYRAYPQLVHSAAWALIALAGIARLNRVAPRIPPALTGGLNVVAAVLLAFLGVQAVANLAQGGDREAGRLRRPRSAQVPKPGGPDIYFIVLDGYARADVLAKYYGFDNGPFLDGPAPARVPGERREPLELLLDLPVDRFVAEPRLHPGTGRRRDSTRAAATAPSSIASCATTAPRNSCAHAATATCTCSPPGAGRRAIRMRTISCPATRACSATSTCARSPMLPGCARSSRRRASTSRAATCRTSRRWPRRRRRPARSSCSPTSCRRTIPTCSTETARCCAARRSRTSSSSRNGCGRTARRTPASSPT